MNYKKKNVLNLYETRHVVLLTTGFWMQYRPFNCIIDFRWKYIFKLKNDNLIYPCIKYTAKQKALSSFFVLTFFSLGYFNFFSKTFILLNC